MMVERVVTRGALLLYIVSMGALALTSCARSESDSEKSEPTEEASSEKAPGEASEKQQPAPGEAETPDETPREGTEENVVEPEPAEVCPTPDDCELTCPEGATVASQGKKMKLCVEADGTRHGPFVSWSADGTRRHLGAYENGQMSGLWREWTPDERLIADMEYVKGVRHGKMTLWYAADKKFYEGSYDEERPIGEHVYFAADGTELGKVSLAPDGTGQWTSWSRSGEKREEGALSAGIRKGLWTSWDKKGIKAEHEYGDDQAGAFRVFHANGAKAVEGKHVAGLPCGSLTCFDEQGTQGVCTAATLPESCTIEDGRYACSGCPGVRSLALNTSVVARSTGLLSSSEGMASLLGTELQTQGYDAVSAWGEFDSSAAIGSTVGNYGLGMGGTGPTSDGAPGAGGFGIGKYGTRGRDGDSSGYGKGTSEDLNTSGNARPRLKAGRPDVSGSLDKRIIRKVVNQHKVEIKACYAKELAKNEGLHGKIVAKWTIDQEGEVASAVVVSSSMNNPKVEGCLEKSIRHWRFPAPKGGGLVIVSYPFVFEAIK